MSVQGTNGGVTVLGLLASVMGGLFMGFISYIVGMVSPSIFTRAVLFEAASAQWQLIPLGELLLCCRTMLWLCQWLCTEQGRMLPAHQVCGYCREPAGSLSSPK